MNLQSNARRYLRAGQCGCDPSSADLARNREAIMRRVAATAAAAAVGAVAKPVMGWLMAVRVGIAVAALVGGTLGVIAGAHHLAQSQGNAARPPERGMEPAAPAASSAAMQPAPAPSDRAPMQPLTVASAGPVPRGQPKAAAEVPGSSIPPIPSSLAGELALIEEAHRALRDQKPDRALEILDSHRAKHPDGMLGQEREAARIVALCSGGREVEGRADAARFAAANPSSPHLGRIEAACRAKASSPAPSASP